jgi:four helix bundle protein
MSNKPQRVRDLKVWQNAILLVEKCYRLSATLPIDERFGLASQIRRAATSVPANIAEGFGRWNAPDFARFLTIASGSLRELETHLVVVQRLGLVRQEATDPLLVAVDELAKMLYRMRQRVLSNGNRTRKDTSAKGRPVPVVKFVC